MPPMHAANPGIAEAQLPAAPSLRSELIKRGVPAAAMFPDHEVESYVLEGSELRVTFKRALELALYDNVKILIAKQVQARLTNDGLEAMQGISASKKIIFANLQAKITGIKRVQDRLMVATDSPLLPHISLDIGSFL